MKTYIDNLPGQSKLLNSERRIKLWEYVKEAHKDQERKYTKEPYYTHLWAVAHKATQHETHPSTFEVAIGHDLYEDTSVTFDALHQVLMQIGYQSYEAMPIALGVLHLTDEFTSEKYPSLNRGERKANEAYRLGGIPSWCQSIKYADLIDNSGSIAERDPGFAKTYLPEKKRVINHMRNGNINLLIECCWVLVQSETMVALHSTKSQDVTE